MKGLRRAAVFPAIVQETLQHTFEGCQGLSAEWSLRLNATGAEVREKAICWLNTERGTSLDWLGRVRTLLPADCLISEFDSGDILNIGLGIGCQDQPLYIHGRREGTAVYLADVGGRFREYQFHSFPMTRSGEQPELFIHDKLRRLFHELKDNAVLQALGGFWLRYQEESVDQVSLSYLHRPPVSDFLRMLEGFSSADLSPWTDQLIKHIAFNAAGDITLYFSGHIPYLPSDFATLQMLARDGAENTQQRVDEYLARCCFGVPRFTVSRESYTAVHDHLGTKRSALSDILRELAAMESDCKTVCLIGGNPAEFPKLSDRLSSEVSATFYVTNGKGFKILAKDSTLLRWFDTENSLPGIFYDAAIVMADTPVTARLTTNLRVFCRKVFALEPV